MRPIGDWSMSMTLSSSSIPSIRLCFPAAPFDPVNHGQQTRSSALARVVDTDASHAGDPEIQARISSYEMAFRMQASVPELMNIGAETKDTLASYGAVPGKASFANNCLLARRLVERGVRFVQLYHQEWDHHDNLPKGLPTQCRETDRAR